MAGDGRSVGRDPAGGPGLACRRALSSQIPGPSAAEISRYRWSKLPASPLGPRSQPLLVWADTELLELGGLKNGTTAGNSVAFNPATRRWHRIASPGPRNVGLVNTVSVWTGPAVRRQRPVRVVSCGKGRGRWNPHRTAGREPGDMTTAINHWLATKLPPGCTGSTWSASAEVKTIRAPGQEAASAAAIANPSGPGRLMSRSIPSGHSPATAASACSPSTAPPASSKPRAASSSAAIARKCGLPSTIRIRPAT